MKLEDEVMELRAEIQLLRTEVNGAHSTHLERLRQEICQLKDMYTGRKPSQGTQATEYVSG